MRPSAAKLPKILTNDALCGCQADARKALAVDPDVKEANGKRLRRH